MNKIIFWVPVAKTTASGKLSTNQPPKGEAIRFKKKGNPRGFFKRQFKEHSAAWIQLGTANQVLIQAALNCGYGYANYERVDISSSAWHALGGFLHHRLATVLTLLQSHSLPLTRSDLHKILESTELRQMSNLMGALFCRVAVDTWANFYHGTTVQQFWHWKIRMDEAVSLSGKLRHAKPAVLEPDFVFKLPHGWHVAEAKGSLFAEDWTELKWGLQQASKYSDLTIYDIKANSSQLHQIEGFACTMVHFDKLGELHVTHLDPPSAGKAEGTGVTLIEAFVPLVRFEEANNQFSLLSRSPQRLPSWAEELTDVQWQLIYEGQVSSDTVYLGKPYFFDALNEQVGLALRLLRSLVPIVGDQLERSTVTRSNPKLPRPDVLKQLRFDLIVNARTSRSRLARRFWMAVLKEVNAPVDRASGPRFWEGLLSRLATKKLFKEIHSEVEISLVDLCARIEQLNATVFRFVRLTARLNQRRDSLGRVLTVRATDNGLLLASGEWSAASPRVQLPKLKI